MTLKLVAMGRVVDVALAGLLAANDRVLVGLVELHRTNSTLIVGFKKFCVELCNNTVSDKDDGGLLPQVPHDEVLVGSDVHFAFDIGVIDDLLEGVVHTSALNALLLFIRQLVVGVKIITVGFNISRFIYGHISGVTHICAKKRAASNYGCLLYFLN